MILIIKQDKIIRIEQDISHISRPTPDCILIESNEIDRVERLKKQNLTLYYSEDLQIITEKITNYMNFTEHTHIIGKK